MDLSYYSLTMLQNVQTYFTFLVMLLSLLLNESRCGTYMI